MEYDTAAIRRAARNLEKIASTVNSIRRNDLTKVTGAADVMTGDTITAIDRSVSSIGEDLNSVRSGLESCADALYAFAKRLDEADEKAKTLVSSM